MAQTLVIFKEYQEHKGYPSGVLWRAVMDEGGVPRQDDYLRWRVTDQLYCVKRVERQMGPVPGSLIVHEPEARQDLIEVWLVKA